MPIYEITTQEHAANGEEFSRNHLYDSDGLTAILDYKGDGAYVTSKGHEISTTIGLVEVPHYNQKNEAGWYIKSFNVHEIPRKESKFDELVRKSSPGNNPGFYAKKDRRAA